MQHIFDQNPAMIDDLKKSLSSPRLTKYLKYANNDDLRALELYQWNAKLSRSLYIYVQGWEICLRNRLNDFLCWKYNAKWPYDQQRAIRQLKAQDYRRLQEVIQRQENARNIAPAPISTIVADLSAGFWVSLLSKNYDVPFKWRHNLQRVFPNDKRMDRSGAWNMCDKALMLRNRIAHHEPIFHLPLDVYHQEMKMIVSAMCPATNAYCEATCDFDDVWTQRPKSSTQEAGKSGSL